MHIPVMVGLLNTDTSPCDLIAGSHIKDPAVKPQDDGSVLINFTQKNQKFTFENIPEAPIPSVLRNFSAPVNLTTDLDNAALTFLMLNDSDGFNKWEAGQQLYLRMLNAMIDEGTQDVCPKFMETIGEIIESGFDGVSDHALLARALTLPSISAIGQSRDVIDPDAIYKARQAFLAAIKRTHRAILDKLYASLKDNGPFSITPEAMGKRALRNVLLGILSSTHGTGCAKRSREHYMQADNMTDRVAALNVIADINQPQREECFDDFYARYKGYPLVVDKYFALQAASPRKDIIQNLKKLKEHTDFIIKNPNRARSLYAAFAMNNPVGFHAVDGSGYDFLTDGIIELNSINPQIAARLLTPMREWKRYTPDRQEKMKAALERILAEKDLSPDVFEIASKSLKA